MNRIFKYASAEQVQKKTFRDALKDSRTKLHRSILAYCGRRIAYGGNMDWIKVSYSKVLYVHILLNERKRAKFTYVSFLFIGNQIRSETAFRSAYSDLAVLRSLCKDLPSARLAYSF